MTANFAVTLPCFQWLLMGCWLVYTEFFSFSYTELFSFSRLKTVVPAYGMNETRQETDPLLCTSLIMVDLFISNSCYVLTRNITNPGSCLLYYLLFLPPVYLFFSYSFNRLTLLFERRKKKGTHPFSSFYPASRAFLVFS